MKTSVRRARLSPEKQDALDRLLRGELADTSDKYGIPRRHSVTDPAPLSFAQQRLWFLDRLEPNNSFYNMPVSLRISGFLDSKALRESFEEILSRHEVLRSVFSEVNGIPVQIVDANAALSFRVVTLERNEESVLEAELQRLISEEINLPFDLIKGPLLRGVLFRLTEQEHVFLITVHHIVSDDWSMGILFRELATLYQSFVMGTASSLSALPIQYADYAVWQRQWLSGDVLKAQLSYWKNKLDSIPALLVLPTDHARPPAQTFRGGAVLFDLTEHLTARLNALSRKYDVTLFMTLLASFQALLYYYSSQEDFCLGSPVANRSRPETEPMIGFFLNTLVLRADMSGDPSFEQLLARVREVALEAHSYQDLPFERVVEELQPVRDLSHSPLFQVMFVLHNFTRKPVDIANLILSPLSIEERTSRFDLCLDMTEENGKLSGWFEYSTDLFDECTIIRMRRHFCTLLERIVDSPTSRLSDMQLLSDTERDQLLIEWNGVTSVEESGDDQHTVHELFEQHARATPNVVAVKWEGDELTYEALNLRADRMARVLRHKGVSTDKIVGLYAERSIEMIVGILAILKAGGAYLPISPELPVDRIAFMLADANASVVMTHSHLRNNLPINEESVMYLDDDRNCVARFVQESTDGHSSIPSQSLAYVLYTSGSTGKPKGVMISHRSFINAYFGWEKTYALKQMPVCHLQMANFSFDVFSGDLVRALCSGGTLLLYPRHQILDAKYLYECIVANGATCGEFVPAILHNLVEYLQANDKKLDCMRLVACGSDSWDVEEYYKCRAVLGEEVRLINSYGLTETTIDSLYFEGAVEEGSVTRWVPIGRPFANVKTYVLNRHRQPVPVGIPGELCIAGLGVGRGYLNRPDMTAERFIPDPFSDQPGTRMYCTGDLVSYRADGSIEFLGRMNNQIKIRGFRIELDEVESVLAEHPQVKKALVVVREDRPSEKRLVAYVVAQDVLSSDALLAFIKEKLPDYMIPSFVNFIDEFPLTANGKIDRKLLPAPDWEVHRDQIVEPRTEREKILATIWAELLNVEQVGVHDNFFGLGGDSILIMQVISRARQQGIGLTPRQFFLHQTIESLAAVAAQTGSVARGERSLVQGRVPLTPIQIWFFEQSLANPHYDTQAVLLETQSTVDWQLVAQAVEVVMAYHDAFRLRFTEDGRTWRQAYDAAKSTVITEKMDLLAGTVAERAALLESAAMSWQGSLHLSQGPLVRAVYFPHESAQSARLLMIIHHLVVDGVSWRILLEDLMLAYRSLADGSAVALPEKTTSWKQWVEQLSRWSETDELLQEMTYWTDPIRDQAKNIPIDIPQGSSTEGETTSVTVSLDEAVTRQLLHEVPSTYRTQINDVLLAALAQVCARWSNSSAVLIALEGHGREDIFEGVDLSRTIGWFTSVFPVALRVEHGASPGVTLKSVKEQLRQIPNRGIGYGVLRYLSSNSGIRTQLAALPSPQLSFNYLGQLDQSFSNEALFQPAQESAGRCHAPENRRPYELDINASILGGRLHVEWGYSRQRYRKETIEKLSQSYVQRLKVLINHCVSSEVREYTPSDFPHVELSEDLLESILEELQ